MTPLRGEDSHRYRSWHRNYFSQCVTFETPVPNVRPTIEARMRRAIAPSDSFARIQVSTQEPAFCYIKSRINSILKRILHQVDSIDFDEIEAYAGERFLPFVVFYSSSAICACFNHTVFDGVSAYNLFQCVFDADHAFRPPSFTYVPGVTELMLLPSFAEVVQERRAYLKYDIDVDERESIHFRHELAKYKTIKRASPAKVAFPSVVVCEMLRALWQSVRVDALTICVLGALDGGGQFFNNYGIIVCEVRRPGRREAPQDYLSYVHACLSERQAMVALTYVGLNIYEHRPPGNSPTIDVMFSGMPMTTNGAGAITMNNVRIRSVKSYMKYTSLPLYCGFLSCDRYVHFYTNTRSTDIDQPELERLLTGHTPPESS